MKNIIVFYLKIFNFLEVKVSIYLSRRVFVMSFLSHYEIVPIAQENSCLGILLKKTAV